MKAPDSKKTSVVIVEDHQMFREQIAHLINKTDDMMVLGGADNVADALRLIKTARPSLAIIDITLKGASGLELLKELRKAGLETPVLILSMHDESLYAERAMHAGANGYVTKHEASEEMLSAIRRVLSGQIYLNPRFMSRIAGRLMTGATSSSVQSVERLADRELEVFELVGRGLTNREISERLGLSMATVETYSMRIREKLNLENIARLRFEASRWVQQRE
jgi:DNA-binding NarL/FixJ family response regulator